MNRKPNQSLQTMAAPAAVMSDLKRWAKKRMKPPFPTKEDFIGAWITMSKFPHGSPEHNEAFWAFQHMYDLIHEQPDVAFGLIVEIWARDQSRPVIQNLSAGPLEDLLATHGPEMIGRVEEEAERNPSLRKLLGGVWKRDMPDSVWSKVQAIWDRRGWDGIPEEGAQPDGTDNSGADLKRSAKNESANSQSRSRGR